ncbi:S24 family peptidase [Salinisphaera sp.]|uniref:LexA family protein n=1 Tax=Salinisphaera sp. TaxID=1914330 RepID=UPI000C576E37|nr:S24 family peptidase [Salinisphaera sp.]MAS09944.1 hypothetical protein [Salinisphaera sp.]|tara:strand:- start:11261 stop:11866 length:606 start_codon:yes stop_codon:yes gene_type:complete
MIEDTRRENLKALVEELGGRSVLADLMGCRPNYISQLAHGHASFGPRAARRIEDAAELSKGWIDTPRDMNIHQLPVLAPSETLLPVKQRRNLEPKRHATFMLEKKSESAFAVQVEDSLMTGGETASFPVGTIIAVEPEIEPQEDQFVWATPDNEETPVFRKLTRDGASWYLAPTNQRYPVKPISDLDRIIGVVTSAQQSLL